MNMQHALVVLGTRPEAIKQAPVVWALRARPDVVRTTVVSTGQHREMLAPMLELLDLVPDIDLGLMQKDQSLSQLAARCMHEMDAVITSAAPDLVVVQGDTTTAMAAALAAFHRRIPVAHVEAGLRSGSMTEPFPEEVNRCVVDLFARWLFAPTEAAATLLRREHITDDRIFVTGNTVVDALERIRRSVTSRHTIVPGVPQDVLDGRRRMVLVTCHRRESHGAAIVTICEAIATLAERHPDVSFVYPVHLNPHVLGPVGDRLAHVNNVHLIAPQPYDGFLALLARAELVLTDSGGVQEEAPSFRVPVLVMRNRTERPEGITAGCAVLVGTERDPIVEATDRLLRDAEARARMTRDGSPYGDGHAGERIADVLLSGVAAEQAAAA
jgi:UDP-N-acetylglucosamine 2-epimerase (non-hydrolysing)